MKKIDAYKRSQKLIYFLRQKFRQTGFKCAVIALSGGIDSSVSCTLAVKAFGGTNVFPLLLPYNSLNQKGIIDAKKIISFLPIPRKNVRKIDIEPLIKPFLKLETNLDKIRLGNIMARIRMILIFDQAKKRKALVIGTENKTEHLLGYFTRYGDSASDIEPLINLYKTQVYELAHYLDIPQKIIQKKPTAGLWQGQTDEDEFGFSYKDADQILYYFFDRKLTWEKIEKKGASRDIIFKVLSRVKNQAFKNKVPYSFKQQII